MDYSLFQGHLPIVLVQENEVTRDMNSYRWRHFRMPNRANAVDKYAVAVMKKDNVVGHLMKGKSK